MITKDFQQLLEQCRIQLVDGKPLGEILREHPAQADQLEPLLQAAELARKLPKPTASQAAFLRGKELLLDEVAELQQKGHFLKIGTNPDLGRYSVHGKAILKNLLVGKENTDMKLVPRFAIYTLITVLVAGFFTFNASASSRPGDALYGLKLGWEKAQLALAFSDDAKLELEQEFDLERISEVQSLLGEGREAQVEFYGWIEAKDGNAWTISGIMVQIDPSTELKGLLEVGTEVKVEAVTQSDGSLLALEIYPASAEQSGDSSDDDAILETQEVEDESETPESEIESETPEGDETEAPEDSDGGDDSSGSKSTPEAEKTDRPDDSSGSGKTETEDDD